MPPSDLPTTSRQSLLQRLESLHAAGVRQLPRADSAAIRAAAQQAVGKKPVGQLPSVEPPPPPQQLQQPTPQQPAQSQPDERPAGEAGVLPSLEVLREEVATCTRCEELAGSRTQTVFGVGDPEARLCFLGEAPGADEDRLGEPFVGRAGQLLNKIIEACTLRREEVYILNILKCRPPNNRNPTPEESSNCKHFLRQQLELIDPEYICCLGAVAAQNLLQTETSIGRLRGRVHDFNGMKVVCTYHPAYLLRNPSAKKHTWEDMKMLMRQMGVEL